MMMMNMGGSGGGSMGSMGSMGGSSSMGSMGSMGGSSSSMGMMDPSMMNMGSMGNQMGMGQMQMNMPMNNMPMQSMTGHGQAGVHGTSGALGFDFISLLTGLFNFAINIFALLLVVALIVGTFVFIKKYLFEGHVNLGGILTPKVNGSCVNCGQGLQAEWNCCPKCGEAKFKPVAQQA